MGDNVMRVAIDMDKMQVVAVHRVQEILHGLVCLEAANIRRIRFETTDSNFFLATLTPIEMQLLFTNVTGEQGQALTHLERRAALAVAIDAIRPPLVDDQELDKQINAVATQLEGKIGEVPFFKYVLGSRVPKVGEGVSARTVVIDDKQRSAAQGAAQRLQPLPAATIPAPRPAGTLRQKTGVARPAGAEPSGGVAGQVWMVADKMWQAAGSPKDVKVVLALRMKMMEVLETEHEVKRTTSSNTLGQWMKARLS
jgi:hypothetical protein